MSLDQEVALRIALATKALPDIEVKTMLSGILSLSGDPLSTAKLNKIRYNKLKSLPFLEEVDEVYVKSALAFLKGRNIQTESEPLPEIQSYQTGEMPESIRVACSSNSGENIDGHFGSCSRFLIYQISSDEIRLVDIRVPPKVEEGEDKNDVRAKSINDCQLLYTMSIGGPAAAKAVKFGLHPIKYPQGGSSLEACQKTQQTLMKSPPPWLAKVMGADAESRVRFQTEEVD